VEWLPFDLHPEYPPEGIPRAQLQARYGPEFRSRVQEAVEAAGYAYAPPADVVPNSRKALELTELARERNLHRQVHDRLMHAYWSEGANIGDEGILLGLAAKAGLDRVEAEAVLADRRYAERVDASTRAAQMHGIHAIPAFVLGGRLLVLGAQPHEVFEQAAAELDASPERR
jgi:predicted DsbA family dithiol-disulfide isomerase